MHVDHIRTHIISCVYHIGSSDNAEPWPLVIEDFDGTTNLVTLTPGDMLLYESAKNLHGRPIPFRGSWYTSLFIHFRPKDPQWIEDDYELNVRSAIPPNWQTIIASDISNSYPELAMVGTSMLEPECPNFWCNLEHAVSWEGPGTYGTVLTAHGKQYSLHGRKDTASLLQDAPDEL